MSAANAESQLKINKEELLLKLDECVATAAQHEHLTGIKEIKDVAYFDDQKLEAYVPGLWQEPPPMACVSDAYRFKIKEIKTMIIDSLDSRRSSVTTSEFVSRITDLWAAILSENFILSFRNTEELKAQRELDEQFTVYRERFDHFCLEQQTMILTDINSLTNNSELQRKKSQIKIDISAKLNKMCQDLIHELWEYFEEHNSYTSTSYIRQLEKQCQDKIVELTSVLTGTYDKKHRLQQLQQATEKCTSAVLKKAKKLALELQSSDDTKSKDAMTTHFEANWPLWLNDLYECDAKYGNDKDYVLQMFNEALKSTFDDIDHELQLQRLLEKSPLRELRGFNFNSYDLNIERTDFSFFRDNNKELANSENEINEVCIAIAKYCNTLVNKIEMYVEKCLAEGAFAKKHAFCIVSEIKQINCADRGSFPEGNITFDIQFVIQFAVDVSKCAINLFIDDAETTVCTTFKRVLYRSLNRSKACLKENS